MPAHKKGSEYETTDSLTFIVSQFSSPNTPRKLLSEKKRDTSNPDVLWRLKVYPNGNGTPGFLALYVDIPSKHSLPEDWSCSRDITFTLHHPTDASKSIFKRTSHTFNDEEPDWGYNQVIPVSALSQRGFLQNDSIKVTATFRAPDTNSVEGSCVVSPTRTSACAPKSPPMSPQTPELTTPRSPSLSNVTTHEFNEREDCRVIVEGFSKASCKPCACEWHAFTENAKYEWRLVVFPHSGAESVSAYIDLRAKDVNDDTWKHTVTATIFLDNPETPAVSVGYPFIKTFKASKSRKGFPLLSLTPILKKEGFLANDTLHVSATAKLLNAPSENDNTTKKIPEIVDAIIMDVHGFLSYDGSTPDSCKIVSPWHKLEGLGRWRFTLYPAGTKNNSGFVSVVVAFQPSDEWSSSNDWQLRVLCEANAIRKTPSEESEGDGCIAFLDPQHLKASLVRVISLQSVIEHKDDYLKWDPDFEDDDTLRIRVLLRTCGPSGPKSFVAKNTMDTCLKDLESGIGKIKKALVDANKPLLDNVQLATISWDKCMKQLEEAFKNQVDIFASLGSELEYKDRLDILNRKLEALKEEEEECAGKGCPVAELNVKEQEMRSTLKKLLLMQTTGCEGNKAESKAPEKEKPKESKPAPAHKEVPKPTISASEMLTRDVALINHLHTLVQQCEKVGALSCSLCKIHDDLVKYMTQLEHWISEQTVLHEEFVLKEKELEEKCEEAKRKNMILRGDDAVLKSLTPEEVSKYVDFVMEAVGQVAVAKYLTKQ